MTEPRKSRVMRPKEVSMLLGVSMATLWRVVSAPDFPIRVRVGPRAVGWFEEDVRDWLESRIGLAEYGWLDNER
jgi:prophage regulatory protein